MKVYPAGLDVNEIHPGLWQGSKPPEGSYLASVGFKVLVLCAKENQPPEKRFPGLEVIYAPNEDQERPITERELHIAVKGARGVTLALQAKRPVLVTCQMGWNRSGLVSALALHMLTGMTGEECIRVVQERRPNALYNVGFLDVLSKLITPRRT